MRSRSPRSRRRNEKPTIPRRNDSSSRNSPRRKDRPTRYSPRRHSPRRDSTPPQHLRHYSLAEEKRHRGPLSRSIMDLPLPVRLEKPPAMDIFDGSTDSVDHIENIEAVLEYKNARGSIKCKLFPTTLRKGTMAGYKRFPPGSIDSWTELCCLFTAHFTASRRHPRTEAKNGTINPCI
ncbi:hypothetical protein L195_g038216 [Trifolium pratense]|uniref:Uncharacterized protein n=1 Tax=Trifolium pratense TaxID=57577 RepID=A0A2K3LUH1_TRIPR|nr:hypothetical protein L195_g038216 [Trifolium pratense]